MKRAWLAAVIAALVVAPVAQAKLAPTFSERSVRAGQLARLDLGEGAESYLAPLKVYLVPLGVADKATTQSDARLTKVGELGSPGNFDVPRTFQFVVPQLEAGEYTIAIWFKGTETGQWANALVGIHPRLAIRGGTNVGQVQPTEAPGTTASDDEGASPLSLLVVGAATVVAGLVAAWRWRRNGRTGPAPAA